MGKWIKCSERMLPGNGYTDKEFLVYETLNNAVQHDYYIVPDDVRKPFWNRLLPTGCRYPSRRKCDVQ